MVAVSGQFDGAVEGGRLPGPQRPVPVAAVAAGGVAASGGTPGRQRSYAARWRRRRGTTDALETWWN
ncbi:hypothetical protein GCM10023336_42280 [Streptomyces similanensis]|uniref:Acyl-CoA carboxylase subunit epsilon n=1 Tax=Streptomyces similanensis TaxID=1274988 RepID=A0ABP9KPJ4_9ACTN